MKILSTKQLQAFDSTVITSGTYTEVEMIHKAGEALAKALKKTCPSSQPLYFLCGTGKNGADALVSAQILSKGGYNCHILIVHFSEKNHPVFTAILEDLQKVSIQVEHINSISSFPDLPSKSVIIDALVGTGISRASTGLLSEVISKINALSNKRIISVDLPSGLSAEGEKFGGVVVEADNTMTLEFPKLALMMADNYKYAGNWQLLELGIDKKFSRPPVTPYLYIDMEIVTAISEKLRRKKFSHKGDFGHPIVIAGSKGKVGAAVLCAKACLRSGAGLVTCYSPKCGYNIIQTSLPEVMVSLDPDENHLSALEVNLNKNNCGVIGPGIGMDRKTIEVFPELLKKLNVPLVVDADALNIISTNIALLELLPKQSILTPHPKEFARLVGQSNSSAEQLKKQINFSKRYQQVLILKGAHTSLAFPNGDVFFNSTGNPGMSIAGSGDVLSGIIGAFLAQGLSSEDASILGVFVHGMAGDLTTKRLGEIGIIANDIIDSLPLALNILISK